MSDAAIDALKVNDVAFFDKVYSGMLGNDQPGDGWTYRGGGLNQLTGKGQYAKYGKLIGVDLVAHPARILEPAIAVEIAVVYMVDRYHGGGWTAMKAAVGNSFGTVDARKNALYQQYLQSGEWNAAPPADAGPAPAVQSDDDDGGWVEDIKADLFRIQSKLNAHDYKAGDPDGWFGKDTSDALTAFAKDHPGRVKTPPTA
jgi:putative chitinase